jgi:F-type H+-transporting ATPase subunit gamma
VVATADRGLCGGFNSSIVRGARRKIAELQGGGKEVKLLCIGRKGRDQLRRDHGKLIVETFEGVGRTRLTFSEAAEIALKIEQMYDAGEFDVCTIVFNQFKSAITQVLTLKQLIPVEAPKVEDEDREAKAVYEFEPEEDAILAELLPRNLAVQIYGALTENNASEQGARMSAMDSATRNAGDMISNLTITYNRTRQAQITKELIEIISGAEAL